MTLVVNGGCFSRDGTPDTPVMSAGVQLGPRHDIANHGRLDLLTPVFGIVRWGLPIVLAVFSR
jgi:hypothetical protein